MLCVNAAQMIFCMAFFLCGKFQWGPAAHYLTLHQTLTFMTFSVLKVDVSCMKRISMNYTQVVHCSHCFHAAFPKLLLLTPLYQAENLGQAKL